MRNELLIAERMYFTNNGEDKRMSRPAVRVALAGIIIGITVMLITVFVVIGFKQEVREKLIGFGSHIQVVNFDNNNTYEMQPVSVTDSLLQSLRDVDGVTEANVFATKPGIIKTDSAFQAIVFKGVDLHRNEAQQSSLAFFCQNLVAGRLPEEKNEILLSSVMANRLQLQVGDAAFCYFIQDKVRVRKFIISGIYNTDLQEFDQLFAIGELRQVQQLNEWDSCQVSGIDIRIRDFSRLEELSNRIYFRTANQADKDGNFLYTQNIVQLNPAIFSWLDLLDMNVIVVIVLMLAVSGFCIISGLLILILEGIPFIGVMKALGADNRYIRRIFLWQAAFLIGIGMVAGNGLGLILCALQYCFHIVPLDPSAYYVSYVPIVFNWTWWAVLNIGTFMVSMLILLAPSAIITRISPAQVMRYE
ncbi:MAG: ABC transporter permease [Bacteroidales bacterium]|nr:ABC transporter permease [Bacteroidales bacterium]